jgi:hydroxymethylpyrimidine/phosphomethylpyrimidine kinase
VWQFALWLGVTPKSKRSSQEMGISEILTAMLGGAAVTELVREAWRRMRASAEVIEPVVAEPKSAPLTIDDLLDSTIEPNLQLLHIEREVLKLTGAGHDSDEADLVMEAVYDGRNWDKVREMCSGHLWTRPGVNRVARWI